jgi:type IV pilus assembly protein PilC
MAQTADSAEKKRALVNYRYEATTAQGKKIKGTLKASSEIDVERTLVTQGYIPVNVEVVPSMWSLEEALPSIFKIKPRDTVVFSRQLATLLRSGISLLPALEILQGQVTTSRAFNKVLQSMVNDLRAGSSFSQAVAKSTKAFPEIYARTITVGERTGNLETVLNSMADFMEKQGDVSRKVGKALTYPMIILCVGVVVGIVLVTFVMPKMTDMFVQLGVELPLPTRILMKVSEIITTYPLVFVIVGALLAAVVLWLVKQPTGRRILDRVKLTGPLIGTPNLMTELARFARTMSVLVTAGLSLQEIMELMPQSTDNRYLRVAFERVNEGLILGEGLSEPMTRVGIFPPLLIQMVIVGEESNTLAFTMGVVADFYEVTAEEKMSSMVSMIGPISTIFIALFVGFIAISVLMPMYSITGAF